MVEDTIMRIYFTGRAETQTWITFAVKCEYWEAEMARKLYRTYDHVIGKLVNMIRNPQPWLLERRNR
jgi:hypothetical protein